MSFKLFDPFIRQVIFTMLLIAVAMLCFHSCNTDKKPSVAPFEIIGVKIYEYSGDYGSLFKEWKEIGINTVFCSKELFSDMEFRLFTKKYNIASFVISPIFFNPEELQADTSLFAITDGGLKAKDDWVEFVCPSRQGYRQKVIENLIEMVQELDPNGISLDFIRHFVFWEIVVPNTSPDTIPNSCFDHSCLTQFQLETEIKIPESKSLPAQSAKWIEENYLEEWVNWKCQLITNMISEIVTEVKKVKPGLIINTHILPWRQGDYNNAIRRVAGQDVTGIANFANYLSPMTYSHMVKREPEWVYSVVADIHRMSDSKILPSIQVKEAYLKDTLGLEEFKRNLEEALKPPSSGVVFWSWEQLEKDPEKKEIIRTVLLNRIQ